MCELQGGPAPINLISRTRKTICEFEWRPVLLMILTHFPSAMRRFELTVLCLAIVAMCGAQQGPEVNELRLKLNEDGSHYVKATFLNQVWIRFNQSNPGTVVLAEPTDNTFDIGLRRTRLQLYGQLTDHVFFYTQFGQNNFNYLSQNAGNRKIQAFFHDVLGEYKVWKDKDVLKLGGGLTITNGLSRFSQPSIGTIMSLDVPIFAQATVDQTDEFSRKLSVYARGQVSKLDYRVILSDPFPITTNGQAIPPVSGNATFSPVGHHKQFQALLIWNFFDSESNTTPYMTGTYLGKKKILNLEAGLISQKDATWTGDFVSQSFHDMTLWSVAIFYDAPLNESQGTALNAYAGYFSTDYGPGYLRYNGIMNPANGLEPGFPVGSHGNAFPMFGTGSVIYAQFGYLMSQGLLGKLGTLLPYATMQSSSLDRLNATMNVYSVGVNWLIKGHTSKLSLDLQSRPTYELQGSNLLLTERKSQIVLQYQISF